MLPQESALLPCAGFVAGFRGWHWGSGTLLKPPEDLHSTLFIETDTDQLAGVIIQRPVAPTVLPYGHTVSSLEVGQGTHLAPSP